MNCCVVVVVKGDMSEFVVVGMFWCDLLYWFNVVMIVLLLFVECCEDIVLLFEYFMFDVVVCYGWFVLVLIDW